MAAYLPESLQYFVHHVFLPSQLPQEAESLPTIKRAEQDLLRLVTTEIKAYRQRHDHATNSSEVGGAWDTIQRMVERWTVLGLEANISEQTLENMFAKFGTTGALSP